MNKYLLSAVLFSLLWLVSCGSGGTEQVMPEVKPLTTFYLVRHAEKVEDGSKNPPLTEKGMMRAEKISQLFAKVAPDALYATPFIRTQSTLQPLADTLGLSVETYDAAQDLVQLMDEMLTKHAGQKVFIAGHSNTIPGMLNVLVGDNVYEDFSHDQYNDIFVVSLSEKGKTVVTRLQLEVTE